MDRPGPGADQAVGRTVDDVLEHFGVKGMRWGVRRSDPSGSAGGEPITIKVQNGKRVVVKGGRGHTTSEDAIRTAKSRQIAKKSSTDSLSTKELQDMVNRMNLEKQYSMLTAKPSRLKKGMNAAKIILSIGKTVNEAVAFANSPTGKFLERELGSRIKKKLE